MQNDIEKIETKFQFHPSLVRKLSDKKMTLWLTFNGDKSFEKCKYIDHLVTMLILTANIDHCNHEMCLTAYFRLSSYWSKNSHYIGLIRFKLAKMCRTLPFANLLAYFSARHSRFIEYQPKATLVSNFTQIVSHISWGNYPIDDASDQVADDMNVMISLVGNDLREAFKR